jgi:release factor glutamine methyltransferase
MKSFFPECEKKFDIIFSNPPYLSIEEYKGLPSIVKKQPFEALVSENKGLFFYEKIIKDSKYFLKKKYLMAFEMSQYQSNKIIKLVIKYVPYASFFVFTDLEKRQRVILI